jgi:predicted nucleic acid-binding protein
VKVLFDTNVYVAFIRDRSYSAELLEHGTTKYLSAIVLMELWAGARTRPAERVVERLQRPYAGAKRVITLRPSQYVAIGQFFAALPPRSHDLRKSAGFLNDVQIAFTAVQLGAILFTEDVHHYEIIREHLTSLRVRLLAS